MSLLLHSISWEFLASCSHVRFFFWFTFTFSIPPQVLLLQRRMPSFFQIQQAPPPQKPARKPQNSPNKQKTHQNGIFFSADSSKTSLYFAKHLLFWRRTVKPAHPDHEERNRFLLASAAAAVVSAPHFAKLIRTLRIRAVSQSKKYLVIQKQHVYIIYIYIT